MERGATSENETEMEEDQKRRRRRTRGGEKPPVREREWYDSDLDESEDESTLFVKDTNVITLIRSEIAANGDDEAGNLSFGFLPNINADDDAKQRNTRTPRIESAEIAEQALTERAGPFEVGSPQPVNELERALEDRKVFEKRVAKLEKANLALTETNLELRKSTEASAAQFDRVEQQRAKERDKANREKRAFMIKLREKDKALADVDVITHWKNWEKVIATGKEIKSRNAWRRELKAKEDAQKELQTARSRMELEIIVAGGKPNSQCTTKGGCYPLAKGKQPCLNCRQMENEGLV